MIPEHLNGPELGNGAFNVVYEHAENDDLVIMRGILDLFKIDVLNLFGILVESDLDVPPANYYCNMSTPQMNLVCWKLIVPTWDDTYIKQQYDMLSVLRHYWHDMTAHYPSVPDSTGWLYKPAFDQWFWLDCATNPNLDDNFVKLAQFIVENQLESLVGADWRPCNWLYDPVSDQYYPSDAVVATDKLKTSGISH